MKRVLLVFDPPDGGVSENVRRLALSLPQHGWEPLVAGPRESIIYEELRAAAVPIVRLPFRPGYGHLLSDMRTLRQLGAMVRRERFEVVHAHNAKAGVLARIADIGTGGVSIYSPHCFPFVAPFSWMRTNTARVIEWACGRVTDMLICVAEEERQQALANRIVPPERTRVIHNGCPEAETGLAPDPELERFRAGRPLAATLCVLREQKRVDVFVDAAPLVLERCPDCVLAVIGDGELREALTRQAQRLRLEERFPGRFGFFAFRQPPARQLASVDVFVLSSSWEAFPISVLEAMACRVPQVATDVGGTSEALISGETGLLCPQEDPDALADAISTLLLDGDRRERMGRAARERFDQEFRVERMVAETAALYDELAAR